MSEAAICLVCRGTGEVVYLGDRDETKQEECNACRGRGFKTESLYQEHLRACLDINLSVFPINEAVAAFNKAWEKKHGKDKPTNSK